MKRGLQRGGFLGRRLVRPRARAADVAVLGSVSAPEVRERGSWGDPGPCEGTKRACFCERHC